jgi:hypothetical protein
VRIVKRAGSSHAVTSSQSRGVETVAPGRRRTENGATIVWVKPLRNGSA